MRKFKIEPFWWDDRFEIYKKDSVEIQDGITILIGCNGSGKSTLIHQIKFILEQENKENSGFTEEGPNFIMEYSDMRSGRSHAMEKFGFNENFDLFARNFSSSEGENVVNNFGDFLGSIRPAIRHAVKENYKEFWIFLDGIDSGVSIDQIRLQFDLYDLIINDIKNAGLIPYIFIATNQYESIGKFKDRCLDVINLEYLTINSYDEYREIIFKSADLKQKRYDEGNARIKSQKRYD